MDRKTALTILSAMLVALGLGGIYAIAEKTKIENNDKIQILKIIDGDTIKMESKSLGKATVKLLGIDAPKSKVCYGAKAELKKILEDKNICLEKDISGTDMYGRLLRYLIVSNGETKDDLLVNNYLLRKGDQNL